MKILVSFLAALLFFGFTVFTLWALGLTETSHPLTLYVTSIPVSIAFGVQLYFQRR